MRLLGLLIAGFVLTRSASAQTVKPADLIGEWVRQGEKGPKYTFRADSTFKLSGVGSVQGSDADVSIDAVGRWRLAGDSLVLSKPELQAQGEPMETDRDVTAEVFGGDLIRMIKLNGRLLTTTTRDGKSQRVYERQGAAKP